MQAGASAAGKGERVDTLMQQRCCIVCGEQRAGFGATTHDPHALISELNL